MCVAGSCEWGYPVSQVSVSMPELPRAILIQYNAFRLSDHHVCFNKRSTDPFPSCGRGGTLLDTNSYKLTNSSTNRNLHNVTDPYHANLHPLIWVLSVGNHKIFTTHMPLCLSRESSVLRVGVVFRVYEPPPPSPLSSSAMPKAARQQVTFEVKVKVKVKVKV